MQNQYLPPSTYEPSILKVHQVLWGIPKAIGQQMRSGASQESTSNSTGIRADEEMGGLSLPADHDQGLAL